MIQKILGEWNIFCGDNEDHEDINDYATLTSDILYIGARVRNIDLRLLARPIKAAHRVIGLGGLNRISEISNDKSMSHKNAGTDKSSEDEAQEERFNTLVDCQILRELLFIVRLEDKLDRLVKSLMRSNDS